MVSAGASTGVSVLAEDQGAAAGYRALFDEHFRGMTALATLLGADDPENLAQEAFVRLHARLGRLRDPAAARAHLRATVVNLSRSRVRHLSVARRHEEWDREPKAPSAEDEALDGLTGSTVMPALAGLSPRHREAVVLRFWLDLSEKKMATAMGVSVGTVKSHLSRGLAALRAALPDRGTVPRAEDEQ